MRGTSKKYKKIHRLVDQIKRTWDKEAIKQLLVFFNPLIQTIVLKVKLNYSSLSPAEIVDTVKSYFLELVLEYQPGYHVPAGKKQGDIIYFPYYVRRHLYGRVCEYYRKGTREVPKSVLEVFAPDSAKHIEAHRVDLILLLERIERKSGELARDVLIAYYLLGFTQIEVAEKFGLSQGRISLILSKISNDLKELDISLNDYI